MNLTIDNRDLGQMNGFLESRVEALKRGLQDAHIDNSRLLALVDELSRQNDELSKANAMLRLNLDITAGLLVKAMNGETVPPQCQGCEDCQ